MNFLMGTIAPLLGTVVLASGAVPGVVTRVFDAFESPATAPAEIRAMSISVLDSRAVKDGKGVDLRMMPFEQAAKLVAGCKALQTHPPRMRERSGSQYFSYRTDWSCNEGLLKGVQVNSSIVVADEKVTFVSLRVGPQVLLAPRPR